MYYFHIHISMHLKQLSFMFSENNESTKGPAMLSNYIISCNFIVGCGLLSKSVNLKLTLAWV